MASASANFEGPSDGGIGVGIGCRVTFFTSLRARSIGAGLRPEDLLILKWRAPHDHVREQEETLSRLVRSVCSSRVGFPLTRFGLFRDAKVQANRDGRLAP